MECHFSVEAKAFSFLAKARRLELRLEERRKMIIGFILLGLQCSIWLVATAEDPLMFPGKKDFVKSFRKYVKVLMVCRGGNKACQLLEVVVYAMLRKAEKGLFGSLRAVEGGVGVVSWVSCGRCWSSSEQRIGRRFLRCSLWRGSSWMVSLRLVAPMRLSYHWRFVG
jgi:hypothetical protein